MKQALILIDIQNDYFPGGAYEQVGMDAAARNAAALLQHFRAHALPLFHIQHVSTRPNAPMFVPGTRGVETNPLVAPLAGEAVAQKHYPNSFRDTPLLGWLRAAAITDVVLCGAMTHMCVDATTRAACDYGFACTVVADACATRDLAWHGRTVAAADVQTAFMAALAASYGRVVSTQEFLAAA